MHLISLNTSILKTFLQEHQGIYFWIQYTGLKAARRVYKKVQTIIKRQKKTVKDILKLDECYNFHKEIS